MNRKARRAYAKTLKKNGMHWGAAKEVANQHTAEMYSVGQKCKLNYEYIIRRPDYKKQIDKFKAWIEDHKDQVLTIAQIRNHGREVTFVEDENAEKFWHNHNTLIPVASATVKLDDGTEKVVPLEGVTTTGDASISDKINQALEEM